MMHIFMKTLLLLLHIFVTNQFISIPIPSHIYTKIKCQQLPNICNGCNERMIYSRYLLGLRKTRKLLNNTTNVNALLSILNFTNAFVSNYSLSALNNTAFNNTETGAKNIIMGNIVLDVSNVEYIHIITKKDKIIIELDKKNKDIFSVMNNLDTYINTISLLGKILNIN